MGANDILTIVISLVLIIIVPGIFVYKDRERRKKMLDKRSALNDTYLYSDPDFSHHQLYHDHSYHDHSWADHSVDSSGIDSSGGDSGGGDSGGGDAGGGDGGGSE